MSAEEQFLLDSLADVDGQILSIEAEMKEKLRPLVEKKDRLVAAIDAWRGRREAKEPINEPTDEEQGPPGLAIMLQFMPKQGLTREALWNLLDQQGTSKSKKKGMINVSIDTNLRLGNLEKTPEGLIRLTEKAYQGRTAQTLRRKGLIP